MPLNAEDVFVIVNKMGAMQFFPGDEAARVGIAEELASMCHTIEEVEWVARRTRSLYPQWPGVHEIRAVYCQKHRPKDGIDAFSSIYPDGIPPEHPPQEPSLLRAPVGRDEYLLSSFPETDSLIAEVAAKTKLAPKLPRPREADEPPPLTEEQKADLRRRIREAEEEYTAAKVPAVTKADEDE
jgi:hypothetical protein